MTTSTSRPRHRPTAFVLVLATAVATLLTVPSPAEASAGCTLWAGGPFLSGDTGGGWDDFILGYGGVSGCSQPVRFDVRLKEAIAFAPDRVVDAVGSAPATDAQGGVGAPCYFDEDFFTRYSYYVEVRGDGQVKQGPRALLRYYCTWY